MRRELVSIPTPRSKFELVQCSNCGNERVVFSHSTLDVKCNSCGALLCEKTGGHARISAKIVKRVD